MKKFFSLFVVALLLCFSFSAFAAVTVPNDNVTFCYVGEDGNTYIYPFPSPESVSGGFRFAYFLEFLATGNSNGYTFYLLDNGFSNGAGFTFCRKHPCKLSQMVLDGPCFKRAVPVYSNVPITGSYKLDAKNDLGHYMVYDGKVIIDEAGIEFNNRNYKNFSQENIYFFKYHRHYETNVEVFSQSFEDMDITIRRLARQFYLVKQSIIPYFVTLRKIHRKVGIDSNTHQIIDWYDFGLPVIGTKRIFSPVLWKLFNSYSHKELPQKEWEKW